MQNDTAKGSVEAEDNNIWENIKKGNIEYLLTANELDIMNDLIKSNQWIIEHLLGIMKIENHPLSKVSRTFKRS